MISGSILAISVSFLMFWKCKFEAVQIKDSFSESFTKNISLPPRRLPWSLSSTTEEVETQVYKRAAGRCQSYLNLLFLKPMFIVSPPFSRITISSVSLSVNFYNIWGTMPTHRNAEAVKLSRSSQLRQVFLGECLPHLTSAFLWFSVVSWV